MRCRFTVYSRLTRCKGVLSRRGVFEADPMISKNESSDLWPEFFSGTRDPARPARSGPGRSGQVRPGQPETNQSAAPAVPGERHFSSTPILWHRLDVLKNALYRKYKGMQVERAVQEGRGEAKKSFLRQKSFFTVEFYFFLEGVPCVAKKFIGPRRSFRPDFFRPGPAWAARTGTGPFSKLF